MNAVKNIPPQIERKGCFYHLCSNFWKHIQSLGLQIQYNNGHNFALHLRILFVLAFLPLNDVTNGFAISCQEIRNNFNADADDLPEYFEDTDISGFRQNALRHDSLYSINLWDMFSRTDQELSGTIDSIEGWHQSFQRHLSVCHPNF